MKKKLKTRLLPADHPKFTSGLSVFTRKRPKKLDVNKDQDDYSVELTLEEAIAYLQEQEKYLAPADPPILGASLLNSKTLPKEYGRRKKAPIRKIKIDTGED